MAQKKRRHKKHKGTQAGGVVPKGTTRRKPRSREEARAQAQARRQGRFDTKPTIVGSSKRAAIAAALFFFVVYLLEKKVSAALSLGVVAFLIYVPISYWTDLFMYNRHQKRKKQPPPDESK